MRRVLMLGCLLLVGCQGLVGPRDRRDHPMAVDQPCLPIEEQQRIVRDRLALPEGSSSVAPRTYAEQPGPKGFGSGR